MPTLHPMPSYIMGESTIIEVICMEEIHKLDVVFGIFANEYDTQEFLILSMINENGDEMTIWM